VRTAGERLFYSETRNLLLIYAPEYPIVIANHDAVLGYRQMHFDLGAATDDIGSCESPRF